MERLLLSRLPLLILCVLCRLLSPGASPAQSIQSLLVQGDSLYLEFDNKKALQLYQQALALDSTDFDTRLKVSRTSYDLGLDLVAEGQLSPAFEDFESSVVHAQSLVAQYPDSARSHFLLAAMLGNLALFKSGREKIILGRLVEEHSKKAIALDPSFAYPYVSLGIYYREVSRLNWLEKSLAKVFFGRLPEVSEEEALQLLQTALKLRPDFPFLHFELAMTFLSTDEPAQAARHLKTLIGLKPETSQDLRNQNYARTLLENMGY